MSVRVDRMPGVQTEQERGWMDLRSSRMLMSRVQGWLQDQTVVDGNLLVTASKMALLTGSTMANMVCMQTMPGVYNVSLVYDKMCLVRHSVWSRKLPVDIQVKKTVLPRLEIIDFTRSSKGAVLMVPHETVVSLLDKKGKRSVELSAHCKEWMVREASQVVLPETDVIRGTILSSCAKVLSFLVRQGVSITLYEWIMPYEDKTIAWCLAVESVSAYLSSSPMIQWSPLAVKRTREEQEEQVDMYDALLRPMTVSVETRAIDVYESKWSRLLTIEARPRQDMSRLTSSMFMCSRLAHDGPVVHVGDRLDGIDLVDFDGIQSGRRVGSIGGQ